MGGRSLHSAVLWASGCVPEALTEVTAAAQPRVKARVLLVRWVKLASPLPFTAAAWTSGDKHTSGQSDHANKTGEAKDKGGRGRSRKNTKREDKGSP